ncbi:hypothetical protein [Marinococcus luteus]|uniref:hypothetical protein n=1 Tax=Marinococcus luteus TaxID=1122204 RepID=UPI002ACCA7A7|nr:hypothetical protein [Marinococcus luteus]MDZ5782131.1 hypothetical protein [Marinococcus luteus]
MSNFAYTKRGKTNEILIGAYKEIINAYYGEEIYSFETEEELFHSIQTYRQKEYIITRLSELPIIDAMWKKEGAARYDTE